jgi:hypothetical protein
MKASAHIGKQCILFHKWEKLNDDGFTSYHRCKKCGKREVRQPENSGYKPVDWKWIIFESDELKID